MADVRQQRAVLVVDRLPVGAVHLRVVEILALNAPRLAEDLRPLGARIDPRFELRDVDRASPTFAGRSVRDDAPAAAVLAAAGLIQQLLAIRREREGANALEERRRCALLELVSVQAERAGASRRASAPCRRRFRPGRPSARCSRRPERAATASRWLDARESMRVVESGLGRRRTAGGSGAGAGRLALAAGPPRHRPPAGAATARLRASTAR